MLDKSVIEQVDITLKYDGYIKKQLDKIEQFRKLESRRLPENIEYEKLSGLRTEARQKLSAVRPLSVGQASRISGVSPADITALIMHLNMRREV